MTKIKEIKNDIIYFENGYELYSDHDQDCCESHYLDFEHIEKSDYKDLEFDLSNNNFFKRASLTILIELLLRLGL